MICPWSECGLEQFVGLKSTFHDFTVGLVTLKTIKRRCPWKMYGALFAGWEGGGYIFSSSAYSCRLHSSPFLCSITEVVSCLNILFDFSAWPNWMQTKCKDCIYVCVFKGRGRLYVNIYLYETEIHNLAKVICN